VTIDGYTQPGASPNTSATSDNAKILIRIDGSKATTPGGSGFVPFDDDGSTFRGMAFTNWANPAISGGTASGASGIEANGVGDYIEGNFFGTDVTGTKAVDSNDHAVANRIGIFADNGPLFGSAPGNIIGGTTPQARNILSNNQVGGILFLSIAYEAHLEGNFIDVDASGTKALGNTDDGVGSNGPTIVIGGTLPGDGNVISANGANVDFNDITNGGAAADSTLQGNLIGTDASGAVSVGSGHGTGVSIYSGPKAELIGGTTPTARNVISGNYYGVYIFDDTSQNVVQGNFIGTDITGTKAVGNAQQGLIQGATSSTAVPAVTTTLGGPVAGAGNLISGNLLDGVSISGTISGGGPYGNLYQGSTIQGNYIGTDLTGKKALPNGGAGIAFLSDATNNTAGGTQPGAGNLIANNKSDGVHIDTQPSNGEGYGNVTVGNTILANGGAGVRVNSGTQNRISQNSIYQNKSLGIDLGAAGPNSNSNCNTDNSGPNNLQNFPQLTAGSGTAFITATATDPNGNTSEFAKAVASSTGSVLDLLGSFNSTANTAFTIEFFSSPTADASGYGQGQTYLGSTQVTTGSDCAIAISHPVTTADADVSVSLSNAEYQFAIGPDFGTNVYTATVQNLGPATAHNVVVQDILPPSLTLSSLYCNTGPCQSSVTTSYGSCTVSGQTVTCSVGTLAAGQTATVNIPVQVLTAGSITNTATVTATETDPALANNTSSVNKTSTYPEPFIDFPGNGQNPNIVPDSALAGSGDLTMLVYGVNFLPSSSIDFNGTKLSAVSFVDNQICGNQFNPYYCAAIEVTVPAALLATAGTATVTVTNPDPGPSGGSNYPTTANFTIASACSYTPYSLFPTSPSTIENDGTTLIAENVDVSANVPTCSWTASSSVPWVVPLETGTQSGQYVALDFAVAPNSSSSTRSGSVTVAGQTFSFTQDANSSCDYTLGTASGNFTPAGGSGSVKVTPNSSSCAPFVVSYAPWITIPESSGLLIDNAPAAFTVAANTGAARQGRIMIGGYVYTVNQSALPCSYTLSQSAALYGADGGSGSFQVKASASSCAWTAKSSDTNSLAVTSGASGTGDGVVKYSAKTNSDGPKTPTITVGDSNGASSIFTVTQASAYSCTFTISPSPKHVGPDGTSDFFILTASQPFCKWTAASSDPTALSVQGVSTGTGTSAVYYAVGQNASTKSRTLTITAGCETFTVNQEGTAASNPAPTITALQPAGATAGGAAFTLTVTGTGFVSGSVVSFNGKAETTTYISATQLTAPIAAAEIATSGVVPVVVTNPAPGGGSSNTVNFTISSGSGPAVTLSPTSLAFSSTTIGTKSAAKNVTLTNAGSSSLTISSIGITGANAADFSETNTCGASLASGANCTIAVTFAPVSAASFSAILSVADNASGSPQTVALTGAGAAAAAPVVSLASASLSFNTPAGSTSDGQSITLTNTGNAAGSPQSVALAGTATSGPAPAASLTPASLSFTTQAGTTSAAQIATLKNAGSAALTISGISLTGPGASAFAQSNTCGASLAAGASCAISVTFTPAAAATFSASLSMADNATGSPQIVMLTGTGTTPPAPAASVTPSSLSFTAQTGAPSAAQTVTLKNTGNAALVISGVTLGGSVAADFVETTSCSSSLNAGSSCTISVTFTPAASGNFSATLSVADNAAGSPQTVALTGSATTPPPSYTLSTTTPAQTIKAGGAAQYNITVTAKNGAYAQAVTLAASGLPPGATASFNPASITPGAPSATSVLSIQTAATTSAAGIGMHLLTTMLAAPALGLLFLAARRRKRWIMLAVLLLASVGVTALSGCGGGFALPGSSAKTYTVTVTGSSGSDSASTTVQLILQ